MYSSYIGSWIHVQSYKHDKSLHRTWDTAMIVDYNEDYIFNTIDKEHLPLLVEKIQPVC